MNQFSWSYAIAKGALPAGIAGIVALLAGKVAEYQATGSVAFTPDESQVLVTAAVALALQVWGTAKNYAKQHPYAPDWLARLLGDVL